MNRREWFKLMMTGAAGLVLDPDKLLWVPGQKTIFIPSGRSLTYSQIVSAEYERILPHIRTLFERDDIFYKTIRDHNVQRISSREMRIPLIIRPGGDNDRNS